VPGKYIYGIIMGGGEVALGIKGVVGTSTVYTIAHEGISGVVSDYTGESFGSMGQEELARCLVAHQTVVEQVVKKHPVLPMKFGTVLASADEVHRLLAQGQSQFSLTLFWIQDKVEVEVVSSWAGGVIEEEAELPVLLDEEALPPEQLRVSRAQRRQSYLERMIGFLQPVSVDVQPHPDMGGRVMRVAFLVDRANLDGFYERIKQLNALFYSQIEFQVIGPLPPYSFAMVEVTKSSPEAIEEARHLLDLSEVDCEVEVRQAYRRLAAEVSPDRGELAGMRLAALHRASDLLVAYCRGQSENGGSFLISVRRSRSDEVQPLRLVEVGA
jgi:hypothetical protein